MGPGLVPMLWFFIFFPFGDDATRGRLFYQTGTVVDQQPIQALMGNPPTAVPASVLSCQNCHGRRGHGRSEGGMIPADITWDALTRPYELLTETGRRRPAYTVPLLVRAITKGIDSAGNPLDPNMPRYQLNERQVADLIAWLRSMEHVQDPGIGDHTIRIGLLGPDGHSSARTDAETAWRAYAAELAAQGGIYGRALELPFLALSGAPDKDMALLRNFVAHQAPFMLVMLGQTTVPPHVADFAHQQEIPLLGGQSLAPPALYREVFYLYAGMGMQGQTLAQYVEKTTGKGLAYILTQPGFEKGAEAIVDGCVQDGWLTRPEIIVLHPNRENLASLKRLVAHKPKYLFNMGLFNKEVDLLASLLEEANHQCTVLTPESLVTPAWLTSRQAWQNLLLTTSVHAKNLAKGGAVYQALVKNQGLARQPNAHRLAALATAVLLQEVLLACGRDLNRETMIRQLEKIFRFETGFAPAVSYNPNRRIGVNEIYLHTYDHRQKLSQYVDSLSLSGAYGGR